MDTDHVPLRQSNDTYEKIRKVDPRESLKKQTRISNQLFTKPSQTKSCLTNYCFIIRGKQMGIYKKDHTSDTGKISQLII